MINMRKVKVKRRFLGDRKDLSLVMKPFGIRPDEMREVMERYDDSLRDFRQYRMLSDVCAYYLRKRQYTESTLFTVRLARDTYGCLPDELKSAFREHGAALGRLCAHLDVNIKAVELVNAARCYALTHDPGISLECYAVDFFDAVDGCSVSGMQGKEAAEGVRDLVLWNLRGVGKSMQGHQGRLPGKGKPVPAGDRTARQAFRMVLDWAEGTEPSPGNIMDEVLSDVNAVEACPGTALPGRVGYLHLMMRRLHWQIVANLAAGEHIPSAVCMLGLFRDLLDACGEATVHSYYVRFRSDLSAIEDLAGKDDALMEVYRSVMKNG